MRSSSSLKLAAISDHATPKASGNTHEILVASAAQIVSAYIMNRPNEPVDLTAMVSDVYRTLASLAHQEQLAQGQRRPSVAVEDSVQDDYLVCLEDGKQVKMLKRYLKANYNMSPEEYRARWNLPATYPMVAPNYAVVRSKLAKEIGLGRRGMPTVAKKLSAQRVAN